MIKDVLPEKVLTPSTLIENSGFLVKLAENKKEIEKAQKLRYQVFNIEKGKGLKVSEGKELDSDEFDEYCLHLLVYNKFNNEVIGTYRAQLGHTAVRNKGFYSNREYDLEGIGDIAEECIELGRSCVSNEYRTGMVVTLLWSAISVLLMRADLTFMFGCVSLESQDPSIAWALYDHFTEKYGTNDRVKAVPKPEFRLERPGNIPSGKKQASTGRIESFIPSLFKGYLRLGGVICGEPAYDREFGTIDFFIMVDTRNIPERYTRFFNYSRSENDS